MTTGRRSDRRVLVLVNDRNCEDFLLSFLEGWPVERVSSPDHLRERLEHETFPLVIVTNFGLGPWQAVDAVPVERGFPVMFLTGHLDGRLARECAAKRIPVHRVPIEPTALIRELKLALDDPRLGMSIE